MLQGVDVVVTRGLAQKLASPPHTAVELDVGAPQAAASWSWARGSTPTQVPIPLACLPSVTTRGANEQVVESTRFRAA